MQMTQQYILILKIFRSKIGKSQSINRELDKLYFWLKLNKLTVQLTVYKTKCMFFRKKRTPENISLFIDNTSIDVVSHLNFAGLLFDENLS